MKIEQSKIIKVKLVDLDRLDPITVFIEDIELGKGKITIECYGKSWSYYWGGMSGKTVSEFFSTIGIDYLSNCLWDHSRDQCEDDYDGVQKLVKDRVLDYRRDYRITKESARAMYDIEDWSEYAPSHQYAEWSVPDDVENDDFETISLNYESIPTKNTAEYNYLIRIVSAVNEALSALNQESNKTLKVGIKQ